MAKKNTKKSVPFTQLLAPKHWPTWIFMGFAWLLGHLPFGAQKKLGHLLGSFLFLVAKRRRHICMTNLTICYPEMSNDEKLALSKQHFQSMGFGFLETFSSWFHKTDQLKVKVEFEGQEVLDAALSEGKGCVFISGHFSSLDICGNLMSRYAVVHPIYKQQNNAVFNFIMERQRSRIFEKTIERSNMREVLRSLKANKIIWYAVDQDYGRKHSVFAPFFNRESATIAHIGRICSMTKAPVLLYDYGRTETGYKMKVTRVDSLPTGDDVDNARIMNQQMEAAIAPKKEQYYWTHRRFKTQKDPEAKSPY